MLSNHHDGYHGEELGNAPDNQQLPRGNTWKVLDHHIAEGETEATQDGAAMSKILGGYVAYPVFNI